MVAGGRKSDEVGNRGRREPRASAEASNGGRSQARAEGYRIESEGSDVRYTRGP